MKEIFFFRCTPPSLDFNNDTALKISVFFITDVCAAAASSSVRSSSERVRQQVQMLSEAELLENNTINHVRRLRLLQIHAG